MEQAQKSKSQHGQHEGSSRERKSAHSSRAINAATMRPPVWYCPSRWLLAHHDPNANIQTLSSHMCLADLNNEGESLLALIDFKQQQQQQQPLQADSQPVARCPYDCRMRVYRGQQLIYSHFLDDIPSCLIGTSINLAQVIPKQAKGAGYNQAQQDLSKPSQTDRHQPLLTVAINDDVYFYHKLKPSHKISLEDEEFILDTLNKSEVDIWQMVRQNKVDVEAMRELLFSLSQEFGQQELTSHSINFLSLESNETRRQYLIAWKLKRLGNGFGEHLMSMDTICCSAARLKYSSPVTRSGDFGQQRETGNFLNNMRWNKVLDIQRDGLVLGTEDRHLLIYELRSVKTRLEAHTRLASTPDHILVERCCPSSFDPKLELKDMSYKILISCRNCRIYSIDCLYIVQEKKLSPNYVKELITLKCNVLAMSWTNSFEELQQQMGSGGQLEPSNGQKDFIVACLDRRVYCYNSRTGLCRWVVELELPITSIVSLPKLQCNSASSSSSSNESSLIAVGCQANRIDFYVSSTGRIVDSIYFSRNDYPQAMTYGRFGREDNCLCVVTNSGGLLIFILKRTAKFAHGQCLSSAASYASDAVDSCSQLFHTTTSRNNKSTTFATDQPSRANQSARKANHHQQTELKLSQPASLPSPFQLTKSSSTSAADQVLDSVLQAEHDCNQPVLFRGPAASLESHLLLATQMQIPAKGRDFVDQILEQSRTSRHVSGTFAKHFIKLADKIKSNVEQTSPSSANNNNNNNNIEAANRVSIAQVTGLGNIYRVSLAIRLNLSPQLDNNNNNEIQPPINSMEAINVIVLLFAPQSDNNNSTRHRSFHLTPSRFELPIEQVRNEQDHEDSTTTTTNSKVGNNKWLIERLIEFKLTMDNENESSDWKESTSLEVCILLNKKPRKSPTDSGGGRQLSSSKLQRPIHVSTISIPSC